MFPNTHIQKSKSMKSVQPLFSSPTLWLQKKFYKLEKSCQGKEKLLNILVSAPYFYDINHPRVTPSERKKSPRETKYLLGEILFTLNAQAIEPKFRRNIFGCHLELNTEPYIPFLSTYINTKYSESAIVQNKDKLF